MKIILLLVLVGIPSGACYYLVKRKAGDQPAQGKCMCLKWGGTSRVHWYICCNNCDLGKKNTCDKKTYQSASDTPYCDECGKDKGIGDAVKMGEFKCGGCKGQDEVERKCTTGLRRIYEIKGLCWAFVKCFKKFCKKKFFKKKAGGFNSTDNKSMPDTCFDLVCDEGETVENCPVDCCYKKNSACQWTSNRCLDECCSESTCCLDTGYTTTSSTTESTSIQTTTKSTSSQEPTESTSSHTPTISTSTEVPTESLSTQETSYTQKTVASASTQTPKEPTSTQEPMMSTSTRVPTESLSTRETLSTQKTVASASTKEPMSTSTRVPTESISTQTTPST